MVPSETWEAFRVWMLGTGHSASTTRKTAANLRWFERELSLRLEGLQLSAAIAFVGEHRDDRKPETLNNWVKDLNNWSRFRELGWRLKGFRVGDPPTVLCPTRKEATRVLRVSWSDPATQSRNRAILYLLADGAIRRNELVHVRVSDLVPPPHGPSVRIRKGKGDRERTVRLSAKTWSVIQEYVERYRNRSDAEALFTTPRGPLSYQFLGKVIQEAGRRAGIPWLSPHKLRHFAATDLLRVGVSVASIQAQLGHSSVLTTQRYLQRRTVQEVADKELRAAGKRRFG